MIAVKIIDGDKNSAKCWAASNQAVKNIDFADLEAHSTVPVRILMRWLNAAQVRAGSAPSPHPLITLVSP